TTAARTLALAFAARAAAAAATAARGPAAPGVLGRARLAHLAVDLADAVAVVVVAGVGGHRRARLARHRHQQVWRDRLGRDLLPGVGLDVGQADRVALAGEADRVALGAQARGAPDAVHVVLGVERQVVVVDVADALDVQAARGHVGGDQDLELPGLELAQQRLALLLRHVAREHADPVAGLLQRARHPLHVYLGVDEHHRAGALAAREQA